jgi:hypothetical protein
MAVATAGVPRVHPARALLVMRRVTLREVARLLDMNEQVLGRQLNGLDRITPRVRRGLSRILARPQAELFFDEDRT